MEYVFYGVMCYVALLLIITTITQEKVTTINKWIMNIWAVIAWIILVSAVPLFQMETIIFLMIMWVVIRNFN